MSKYPLISVLALVFAGAVSSACSSDPAAGPAGSTGDLGFRPATHGFKFENYTEVPGGENLTPVEMRRLFGDGVCASKAGDTCTLAPQASQWMEQINKAMSVGHCEGMAVLSKLFFAKKLSPSDFGADETPKLELNGNTKLQREIAFWWATQATSPAAPARNMKLPPREVADQLARAFTEGAAKETYTIAFFKKDMTGGHAVTPYAVVQDGKKVKILVYDNNFPNVEKAIEIDREANTWRYFASQNPGEQGSEYTGDAQTNSLGFTPASARAQQQTCDFCANIKPESPAQPAPRQLQHNGGGNVVVQDQSGNQTGVKDGQVVNDIPAAEVQPVLGDGPEYWNQKHDPFYSLPGGGALTVTLDGSSASAASKSDVTMTGPGYVLAVDGIDLAPDQKDTITFSADNTEVTYKTTSQETPAIVLGVQLDGADYLFVIRAHGTAGGVSVDLKIDIVKGQLAITMNGAQAQGGYDIEVHRIDDAGDAVFTHTGNNESDGDIIFLDYGTWKGQGTPLTIEIDQGGDGSIDSTQPLSDQE